MTKRKREKSDGIEELKNQLARALADYDNLRKRVESERELWIKFSGERILTKLLPVLDILESAQVHLKDQGLAIALGEFKKVFKDEGVEEIKPSVGDSFDHSVHEVVEAVSGGKRGTIAELVQVGWRFKEGKVIRAAKVKVYDKESDKKEELEKEMRKGEYM